jgi:predicted GH43/DUF377 family glycosyl hydrolase
MTRQTGVMAQPGYTTPTVRAPAHSRAAQKRRDSELAGPNPEPRHPVESANVELYRKLVLQAAERTFEAAGVCNPSCIARDGVTHMFYRAISRSRRSVIGHCQLNDRHEVIHRSPLPALDIERDYELYGLEDPKVMRLGDEYCLLYHAFGPQGVATAYATSPDLRRFTKRGIVKPVQDYIPWLQAIRDPRAAIHYERLQQEFKSRAASLRLWGKDFVLFPDRIGGRLAALYRVPPLVFLAFFDSLEDLTPEFWSARPDTLMEHLVLAPESWFETRSLSSSVVPVLIDQGWLLFFHAIEATERGAIYRASAALLDRDDPRATIGRLREPLLGPMFDWEQHGINDNTVYPSSAIVSGDRVHLYYGAADSAIGVAAIDLPALVQALGVPASTGTMT